MKIPKPTDADKDRFRSLVPDDPRVEIKPMFGNLAAFVNGNMFMGLFGPDVGIRLSSEDCDRLLAEDGAGSFGPDDRPMREYVALPPGWHTALDKADAWITRSLDHVSQFPTKTRVTPRRL